MEKSYPEVETIKKAIERFGDASYINVIEPLPENFERSFTSILDHITKCSLNDSGAESMLSAPLASDYEGIISLEQCMEEM